MKMIKVGDIIKFMDDPKPYLVLRSKEINDFESCCSWYPDHRSEDFDWRKAKHRKLGFDVELLFNNKIIKRKITYVGDYKQNDQYWIEFDVIASPIDSGSIYHRRIPIEQINNQHL